MADTDARNVSEVAQVRKLPWDPERRHGGNGSVLRMFRPPRVDDAPRSWSESVRSTLQRIVGDALGAGWDLVRRLAVIGPTSRRARRFGSFGARSAICFPVNTVMNERFIHIGDDTLIGPGVTLSAGMVPGQICRTDRVVVIGDRCLIGRGSGIVGHLSVTIGDDVWTGHHVYITDQNHGYDDPTRPISVQVQPEEPVSIGSGSWLGHGAVVLPGARIGDHVVIGANSVVVGEIPSFSIAVGAPARVIRSLTTQQPIEDATDAEEL